MAHHNSKCKINDFDVTFYTLEQNLPSPLCVLIFCDLDKVDDLSESINMLRSDFGNDFPIYIALNFLVTGRLCNLTIMQNFNCKGIFAITSNNNLLQVENIISQYLDQLVIV